MSAQKFSFDRQFGPDRVSPFGAKPQEAMLPVAEHERLMAERAAAVQAQAYAQGLAAARGEENSRLATAFEVLSAHLAEISGSLGRIESQAAEEAAQFAMAFSRKLAAGLVEAQPLKPIEEAARLAFRDLRGAPHIVARVAPGLVEGVKTRLQRLAMEMGLDGRIVVMGEPEIAIGDARIEWADGGVVRDRARAEREIAAAVETALIHASLHADRGANA
jgi:flagellar assembly protein FliH